jgi:hypothetical protein
LADRWRRISSKAIIDLKVADISLAGVARPEDAVLVRRRQVLHGNPLLGVTDVRQIKAMHIYRPDKITNAPSLLDLDVLGRPRLSAPDWPSSTNSTKRCSPEGAFDPLSAGTRSPATAATR